MNYPHHVRIYRLQPSGETDDFGQPLDPIEVPIYEGPGDVQDSASERVLSRYSVDLDQGSVVFLPIAVTDIDLGDNVETPFGTGTVEGKRHLDNSLAVRLA